MSDPQDEDGDREPPRFSPTAVSHPDQPGYDIPLPTVAVNAEPDPEAPPPEAKTSIKGADEPEIRGGPVLRAGQVPPDTEPEREPAPADNTF